MARSRQVFAVKLSAKWVPHNLLEVARRALHRLLGFQEFNAIYAELPPCPATDFPRTFLEAMQVRVAFAGVSPDAIPATGPLIVVANHPYGFIEGLALDALLLERRQDVTLMAMYVFAAIPELLERHIFVDQKRSRRKRKLNPQAWRRTFEWLERGGTLGVFPAGRVARFQWRSMQVAEQPWSSHIAAIARRTKTPVLPVYFHGRNNWLFQLVGILHPRLQDLLFIREITNKRGRTLRATIGALVEPHELLRFSTDEDATRFLRQEMEKLAQ